MVAVELGSKQEPRLLTGAIPHEGGNDLTAVPVKWSVKLSGA
jgi:hypothetical protein